VKRIAPEWNEILIQCQVKPTTAAIWSEVLAAVIDEKSFSGGEADLRNFLAQTLHETSLLERLEENLNYSAARIREIAAKFRMGTRWYELGKVADLVAHNPEAIANRLYGGRFGNTQPGDGWKYRGRGIPMCTFRDNYALVQKVTGLSVLKDPDLLAQPLPALQAGIAWWERKVPDAILSDPEAVSRAVSGGDIGMDHRLALTEVVAGALA
jgi:putative chitinase